MRKYLCILSCQTYLLSTHLYININNIFSRLISHLEHVLRKELLMLVRNLFIALVQDQNLKTKNLIHLYCVNRTIQKRIFILYLLETEKVGMNCVCFMRGCIIIRMNVKKLTLTVNMSSQQNMKMFFSYTVAFF